MNKALILLIALSPVLLGCIPAGEADAGAPPKIQSIYDGTPVPRGQALFRKVMLDSQNRARREVGLAALQWDDALARDAATYARAMAKSGKFAHDPQTDVAVRQGENLWMGTRDAFSYAEMSGGWIDEDRYFKKGAFPESSTTGRWSDVGHYTQIIWATTTHMGCAIASNRKDDYLVCRYSPAGNVVGRNPLTG
ncbi:MAG: CAP domain-containing protein [Pseudomonadota bacterium]